MAQEIEECDLTTKFPQFDVVSNHSDHHYVINKLKQDPSNGSDCFANTSSNVYRKIMREWRILEKSLPETIYVRVYEQRVDLMRAVIVGPAGTPYQDGLFFFDLIFPIDYPAKPPNVCYRSFGMRINPNLYASGYVCLSLLNTWHGKKTEKWDPENSTVLQILVSLQGLVLNQSPYFNEPGTGLILLGWAKKSNAYSENCFILSCKTMINLLRKPPKNFKDLVTWHFRVRARAILSSCEAYANDRVRFEPIEVSNDFKSAIKVLYPQLVSAFIKAGATINDDVARLVLVEDKETVSFKKKNEKKKTAPFKKMVTKIRKILGINKKDKKVGVAQGDL